MQFQSEGKFAAFHKVVQTAHEVPEAREGKEGGMEGGRASRGEEIWEPVNRST
jgi:hypothetical protein